MKTAKLGIIFVVGMMALAGIGASYAQWTDTVNISATATTGNVELRITDFGVCHQDNYDSWEPSWTGVGNWGTAESITVTVDPTYPGWDAFVCLKVKNTGDIPIKMYSIKIDRVSGNSNLMGYYMYGIPDGNTWCHIGNNGNVYHYHSFNWWNTERLYTDLLDETNIPVLMPGETVVLGAYFELRSDTPQWENTALTVTITLKAIQEVP